MKIKKMKFLDTFKVLKMHKTRSKYMKKEFSPFILKNSFLFVGCYLRKKITAYIGIDNKKAIGIAYITHFRENNLGINISENYQNKKIGQQLMNHLLKDKEIKNKEINLTVHGKNIIATNFYKKFGFKEIGKTLRMKKATQQ